MKLASPLPSCRSLRCRRTPSSRRARNSTRRLPPVLAPAFVATGAARLTAVGPNPSEASGTPAAATRTNRAPSLSRIPSRTATFGAGCRRTLTSSRGTGRCVAGAGTRRGRAQPWGQRPARVSVLAVAVRPGGPRPSRRIELVVGTRSGDGLRSAGGRPPAGGGCAAYSGRPSVQAFWWLRRRVEFGRHTALEELRCVLQPTSSSGHQSRPRARPGQGRYAAATRGIGRPRFAGPSPARPTRSSSPGRARAAGLAPRSGTSRSGCPRAGRITGPFQPGSSPSRLRRMNVWTAVIASSIRLAVSRRPASTSSRSRSVRSAGSSRTPHSRAAAPVHRHRYASARRGRARAARH